MLEMPIPVHTSNSAGTGERLFISGAQAAADC